MRASSLCNVFLALSLATAACATGARAQTAALPSTEPPQGSTEPVDAAVVDAVPAPAVSTPSGQEDPGVEADFQLATSKFLAGDSLGAKTLATSMRNSSRPEVRERASALLAVILLQSGDAGQAQRTLLPGSAASAQTNFLAGVAAARLGQPAIAWEHLSPFVSSQNPPLVPGLSAEEAEQMMIVAGAQSAAGTGHIELALASWQRYADAGSKVERLYALRSAEAAVAKLSEVDALTLYQNNRNKISRTVLASKASLALAASGRANEAKQAAAEAASLRIEFDSDSAAASPVWVGTGDPSRLGLSMPSTGKAQPLGFALTRGAVVAIGGAFSAKDVAPLQVMMRDTTGTGGSLRAATELSRQEAVIGVVGLYDAPTIDQMTRDGVPYVALGGANPGAQSTAFQLIHDADARVRALAQVARARGIRNFAVLTPDSDAARRNVDAFRQAVTTLGGQIVVELKYAPTATAFTKEVEALKKQRWEALFVPDSAEKLELIGPALAVADLWPQAAAAVTATVRDKPKKASAAANRRNILLLSTAAGVSKRTLTRAGRYLQGMLVAPGYFADPDQASASRFVSEFKGLYGHEPSASDAYGFDGVHLLRACIERGARSRADVLRMLASGGEFQGVTGVIHFGSDHGRQDRALVYEVGDDRLMAQP
jgi:branched-chain amino acid transport system substrate-binding protein